MPRHPCPRLPQEALGKRERATSATAASPCPQVLLSTAAAVGAVRSWNCPGAPGVSIFIFAFLAGLGMGTRGKTEGGDDGMKFYDPILWLIGGVLAYALLSHFFG